MEHEEATGRGDRAGRETSEVEEMHLGDVEVHAAIKRFLDHAEIRLADVEIHTPVATDRPSRTPEGGQERPGSSVVILTASENLDYLFKALEEGALDSALKNTSRKELDAIVRQVLRGESPLDSGTAARLLQKVAGAGRQRSKHPPEQLTRRQLDVLALLAEGLTNREIAQRLVLSTGTVRTHVQHIIAKLGVSDRTGAVVKGIELGLVSANSDA